MSVSKKNLNSDSLSDLGSRTWKKPMRQTFLNDFRYFTLDHLSSVKIVIEAFLLLLLIGF